MLLYLINYNYFSNKGKINLITCIFNSGSDYFLESLFELQELHGI